MDLNLYGKGKEYGDNHYQSKSHIWDLGGTTKGG